jgi:predicted transcriptional regulator of viral defense system
MAEAFTNQKWVELLRRGKSIYAFTELLRLTGISSTALRRALVRLGKADLLVNLGKGFYANQLHAPALEETASVLYPPAYISLESALFMHGVLDQTPHALTCVTVNKTKHFRTKLGEIFYNHIKPSLFFGYRSDGRIFIAEAEKAALDFIYLQKQNGLEPTLDEWNWEHLDRKRMHEMMKKYPATVKRSVAKSEVGLDLAAPADSSSRSSEHLVFTLPAKSESTRAKQPRRSPKI